MRRILLGVLALLLLGVAGYALWRPGATVSDGKHDRGENAVWVAHGWLGADSWFVENGKVSEMSSYRSAARMELLARKLRSHGVRDLFPHLCPTDYKGTIPPVHPAQVEAFLDTFHDFRVIPWVGGVNGASVRLRNPAWRKEFASSIARLMQQHPRLAGVQVNIEPLPDGTAEFLVLLEEIRAAMPPSKLLSVAAYPPPTWWHPVPEVHWGETYFREVSSRCDQMAVMMYDAGQRYEKAYQHLMRAWTRETLQWSGGTKILLGVPAYDDKGVVYHHPHVENVTNALRGIHAGLNDTGLVPAYQGVAIYAEWEISDHEWEILRHEFLKTP